jgi:hypothetical protein
MEKSIRDFQTPKQRYKVILEDPELGVRFKSEASEKFFEYYGDLLEVYSVMDRQDKFVYAEELAEIMNFGLGVQQLHFRLGNELIRTESDSQENKRIIKENEQTLVNNHTLFLSNIIESRFGTATGRFAEGISLHFTTLIEQFPGANYSAMRNKAAAMQEKIESTVLKSALAGLVEKLDAKQNASAQTTPL